MKNYLIALSLFTFSILPSTLLAVNNNNTANEQKEQSKKRERDENDQLLNDHEPKQKKIQTTNEIILTNLAACKSTLNLLDNDINQFITTFQSLRFDDDFEESNKEAFAEETLKTNNPLFVLQMIKKIIDHRKISIDMENYEILISLLNDMTDIDNCISFIEKTKIFDLCNEAWNLESYADFINTYNLLKNKYDHEIALDILKKIKDSTPIQLYACTYEILIGAFLSTNQDIFEQIKIISKSFKYINTNKDFFASFIDTIFENYENEPIIKNIQTINELIEIGNVKNISSKIYFELLVLLKQINKNEYDYYIINIKKLIIHEYDSLNTYCNIIKIINCIKSSQHNNKNKCQFFDKIKNIFPEINSEHLKKIDTFLSKITSKNVLNIFEHAQIIEFLTQTSIDLKEKFSDFINPLDQAYEKYDWSKNIYSKLKIIHTLDLNTEKVYIKKFINNLCINKYKNILDAITDISSFTFIKSLNIKSNNLTSLPESIKYLENLKELHLHKNDLTTIPDSIKYLKKLRFLNISSNKITSLPEWIGDLENLEELHINNNKITKLPDSLQKLKKLTRLNLSCNKIASLPDWIGDLKNLQILQLGRGRLFKKKHSYGNKLTKLPTSIGNLKKLSILTIDHNNIAILPDEIGNLTMLTELNLSKNKLTMLPDSIGNLGNLMVLRLSNNKLTMLPDSIGNLDNLNVLNLSKNELSALPNTTQNLSELILLSIDNNAITSFPSVIVNLRNLYHLDLNHNQLESIDDSIGNLINLKYLNLSSNKITSIPHSIERLYKLTDLQLNNNKINALPESISFLSSLKNLNLNYNNITNLPDSFSKLTSLSFLGLASNGLTSLPLTITELYNLQKLVISENEISSLPDSMSKLGALNKLISHRCKFETFPEVIFTLPHLNELDLNDNQIKIIPNEIGNLTELETLNLNNNQIEEIPCTIKKLSSLTKLCLGGNKFIDFPKAICSLRTLQELYLNDNQIKTVPIKIEKLDILRILNLCNNQIEEIPDNIRILNELEELYLSINKITHFPEAIANLTNLNTLYIGTNQIKVIPDEIGNLTKLKTLSFYKNQIETIPDTIKNLINLNSLYLGCNKLTYIPNTIGLLSNLKELRLDNNLLTFTPASLRGIKTLTELNLNNNPDLIHKGENGITLGKKELRKYFKNCIQLKPMLTENKTEKDVFEFMDEFSSRINHNQFSLNGLPEIIVDKIFDHQEMSDTLAKIISQLNLQDPNQPGYICYEIITNDDTTYAEQEISNADKINLFLTPRLFKYIDTLYGLIAEDDVEILQMYPEQIHDTQKSLTFNLQSILNEEDLDIKALQFTTLAGGLLYCATGQSEGNNSVHYAAQGQYYTNDFQYNLKRFLAAKKNEYFTTAILKKGFDNSQNVHLISKYRDVLKPILGLSTAITSFYERIGANEQQDVFYGNKWNALQTFYDLVTPDLLINWVFEAAETLEDQKDYNKQFKRDVPKDQKEEYLQNIKKKIRKNKMIRPFKTGEICAYLINEKLMIGKKNWEKYFTENPCKIGNNATLTHEGANAILIHEGFIIEDPEDDEMIIDDTFEGDNLNNSIIS